MDTAWAQLQTYTKTYTLSPLSLTRGPHMSSSSSYSPVLSPSRAPGRRVTIAGPSPSSLTSHHRPPPVPYAPPLTPQRHHETAPCFLSSIRAHSAIAALSQAPPPPWPHWGRALRSAPRHHRSLRRFLRWHRKETTHPSSSSLASIRA